MSRQKVDPTRPRDYSYNRENRLEQPRKVTNPNHHGNRQEKFEVYQTQYDVIEDSPDSKIAKRSSSNTRCMLMTALIIIIVVAAVVVPVVILMKDGEEPETASESSVLKNSAKDGTLSSTHAPKITKRDTSFSSTSSTTTTTTKPPKTHVHKTSTKTKETTATTTTTLKPTTQRTNDIETTRKKVPTTSTTKRPSTTTSPTTSTTTTTTTKGPTTTPLAVTEVKMEGSATVLNVGSATLVCMVTNPNNWHHVTITHRDMRGKARDIFTFEKGSSPYLASGLDSSRITLTSVATSTEITSTITLAPAQCEDVGTYYCDVTTETGNTRAATSLTANAMPSDPTLVVPEYFISGEESAVTCTGSVGFPGGAMSLYVVNKYDGSEKEITRSGGLLINRKRENCQNIIRASFKYKPTSSWDRTAIVCRSVNPFVSNEVVVSKEKSLDLHILPRNICPSTKSMTVPYLGACSEFIKCDEGRVTFLKCPQNTCYNEQKAMCLGGSTSIDEEVEFETFQPMLKRSSDLVTAYFPNITEEFTLTLTYSSNNGETFTELISVTLETDTASPTMTSLGLSSNVTRMNETVWVIVESDAFMCSASGLYKWQFDFKQETIIRMMDIQVKSYPSKPELRLTYDLQEGVSTEAECHASVGYPGGALKWYLKAEGMASFMEINIGKSEFESGKCGNTVVSKFIYTPIMAANGAVLKCMVSNNNFQYEEQSALRELWIVTGRECNGRDPGVKLQYPHGCDKYIKCSESGQTLHTCEEGSCFDSETQTCTVS